MYTVYALYSAKSGKHYYGYTSDLAGRLLSHNFLGKDWTAGYRPWVLIYTRVFADKKEIKAYKKWLKGVVSRSF